MRVLAIYAINEHIAELMLEAEQSRLARQATARPSIVRRLADAVRAAASRRSPGASPAAA
jgi:hypothetical protein